VRSAHSAIPASRALARLHPISKLAVILEEPAWYTKCRRYFVFSFNTPQGKPRRPLCRRIFSQNIDLKEVGRRLYALFYPQRAASVLRCSMLAKSTAPTFGRRSIVIRSPDEIR
jgi:hypothetical protein